MTSQDAATPSWPEPAGRVFSSGRLPLAARYTALLGDQGVVRGLIGPREVPRLWDRHVLNCALLAKLLPPDATVCDIGSGAGLPGVVLAIARPDARVTLVEPLLRRTTFLQEAVDQLGLVNVVVVRGRAEEQHGGSRFDVVTSRAVAPLDRLLGWSMPLVAPSGVLLAMKGSSASEEVAEHRKVWQRLGCATPEVVSLDAGEAVSTATVVRVAWADPRAVSSDAAAAPRRGSAPGAARRRARSSSRNPRRPAP